MMTRHRSMHLISTARCLVMKFGGASLKTSSHFSYVAKQIKKKLACYPRLIVVVSAMEQMTDQLMQLAFKLSCSPPEREQDMLLSVGERISMSLLAIALAEEGVKAISLTGSQSGIMTSKEHLNARILNVHPYRVEENLKKKRVVIVAGFQGVSQSKEITTLGRGGSDTTAVALAIALRAEKVEFYKDVLGFYEEDPKKKKDVKLFDTIDFKKAFDLARKNHSPVHLRAILLASKNHIPLNVMNFREDQRKYFSGTIIRHGSKFEKVRPVYEGCQNKSKKENSS